MSSSATGSSARSALPDVWPADGLETVPDCPVCGATGRVTLYSGLRDRAFRSAPGEWTLVRCTGCDSAFLDPRPTPATIGLAYGSYYTHADADAPSPAPVAGARVRLAHDYRRARWGYEQGMPIPGGRLLAKLLPSRAAIVDREVRHLPAKQDGRLLDVGCGDGAFVSYMTDLGWQAEGVDPDPAAIQGARAGLDLTEGTLATIDDAEHAGVYDAITMSHVIEHVHEPIDELERVARLLRQGGMLWIATPNLESLGHRRFGRNWRGLEPPRHLVLFTRNSLERLLKQIGLEPLDAPSCAPLARLQWPESAAIQQGRLSQEGPIGGKRRVAALATLANFLVRANPRHADEMVAIARKPI